MGTQSHKAKDRSTPYLLALVFVFLATGIIAAGSLYYQIAQWWTVLLVGVMFFGSGLILGRWRTQFYKERSKAAEAIRESEARFRVLFEQATDGMLLVDVETRHFVLTNRQMQKLLGYSEKELLRLTVSDIHPADDFPRVLDHFEKLVRHEIMIAPDIPVRRKDGTVFFADIGATPVRLHQRDCLLGIFRDITNRRQAEEALRASEEQYRRITNCIPDLIWSMDLSGRFTYVNSAVECNYGWTVEEFLKLTFRDTTTPRQAAEKTAIIAEELAKAASPQYDHNKVRTFESEELRKDGSVFWAEIRASFLWSNDGKPVGITGIARDITERKRAEETLHRSETELHVILESTADGILAVDKQGKVVKTNQRFAELWRIPQSLITGGDDKALLDFVLDQLTDPDAFLKKLQALYKSEAIDMDTLTFKDGRIFERYSSPMIIEGGVVGRVWSFRDATEQRRLQQKLLQSRKMEAIGQLTAGIAHEFNNLMTAILGYSNLVLARLPSDSPLRRDLEQLEKASNRAVALTRQLLTFGRKYPQELKSINLNTIVLNMQQMLQPLLGPTIRLTASLDPALNIVIADPSQMEQIIMNMAVNARDAMPNGGELTIATANIHIDEDMAWRHPESTPGSYIRLMVSDTGTGMSDEVKAKLFDPFFTTKAVGQGTGLGLATCIGIIRQTGGFIDVDSVPGKGTTFQIFLPQARANAGGAQPTNQ